MRRMRAWFLRLGGFFNKGRWNRELAEELESHLQMNIDDNLRSGMSAGEARRQALIKLGGMEPTKENYRARAGLPGLETLMHDFRYGLRMLGKSPGFTAAAVLTLALGIGANSTVFSWINATLLNPIPGLARGSQVVAVERGLDNPLSYPDFVDLRDRSRSFQGVTGFALWPMGLTGNGKPQQIWGTLVTANYFDVLGVKPVLGRGFLPSEGKARNGAPVAVISYRLWQNRYGGEPSIVGRIIHIDMHPFTVVGVAPRAFQGSYTGLRAELWAPVMMAPQLMPQLISGDDYLTTRTDTWLNALGRLRPGVGREPAQAELTTLFQEIARQFPDSHKGANRITVDPLWRSPTGTNRFLSSLLPMLLGLAGVVLLLACANIANLLLERGVSRQRELAIRLSLGASRSRLVRQLLMESLILSLAGGALALLITLWTAASFMDFVPASGLPVWLSASVDGRVLLVTLGISVITALLFGILPALRASSMNPVNVLKDESGSVAGGRRKAWLSSGLAVAQIALSLVLLISAALFVRSFLAANRFNPGFNPRHVLLESYDLFASGYRQADGDVFNGQALRNVEALPGVKSAALADWVPLGYSNNTDDFVPEGYVPGKHEDINAGMNHVSPGYFRTIEIPLERGRDFTRRDAANSQPVVIINQALAARYWPHQDAIGKRMKVEAKWAVVVGVARNTDYYGLNETPQPFLYLPLSQFYSSRVILHVRTTGNPLGLAAAVEQVIHQLNAGMPVFSVDTLEALTQAASSGQRLAGALAGVFGLIALVLAALGIYGVIAYSARQRTHEIGIRMALGARPDDVLRMVLGQGARLALIGVVIGLAASLAVTRLTSGILFGVSATDPFTFVGVAILLAAVALVACYIPARRAMRVEPTVALRCE